MAKIDKTKINKALKSTARGRVLSIKFFKKYMFQIIFITVLIMMYVASRYDYKTSMEETVKLKDSLNVARTEMQQQRSKYMSSIRESSMQQIADTLHLDLAIRERPPYVIEY